MAKRKKVHRQPDPPKLSFYCVTVPLPENQSLPNKTTWHLHPKDKPHCRGYSIRDNSVLALCLAYDNAEAAMLAVDKARDTDNVQFPKFTVVDVYCHQDGPTKVHYIRL